MKRGKFITVEGIEGVGKSTNIAALVTRFKAQGIRVLATREPGGTPMAEQLRQLLLTSTDEAVPDMAELLMMFAARSLHVNNVIEPALASGQWVVCDRFTDASRAYQGGGRGMSMQIIDTLAEWVQQDLVPDLTVLLDAPVETGLLRARERGAGDRFERQKADFFARVRECYLQLAAREPDRFVVVDADRKLAEVRASLDWIADGLLANK